LSQTLIISHVWKFNNMASNSSLISDLVSSTSKDLVTKNLDLTRAVMDFVNGNGTATVAKAGVEIIQWLARERIDKSDYLYFIERAGCIAYPNEQGLEIRDHILRSEAKLSRLSKLGGLQLKRGGSLGRWVAFSDEHIWLVTTVASMSAFYNLERTTNILVKMALSAHQRHPAHNLQRQRLKAILGRVCESIALHVVNPGHSVGALPRELSELCAHLCDPLTLGDIFSKIHQSKKDILVYCDRFPAPLVSWLLVHFEGIVEVSLGGAKIYTKSGGHITRSVTILVKKRCPQGICSVTGQETIRVCERHDQDWKSIVYMKEDPRLHSTSLQRHSLYHTDDYSRFRMLSFQARNKITQTACGVVSWLLSIRLEYRPLYWCFAFRSIPNSSSRHQGASSIPLSSLLSRWPDKEFAKSKPDDSVVDTSRMNWLEEEDPGKLLLSAISNGPLPIDEVVDMFPLVKDMLNHDSIKEFCTCPQCEKNDPISRCKKGCMRETAVACLFFLIGHAIADGFGVEAASGMIDLDDYVHAVHKLLSQLKHGYVIWNTWFNVAASTVLGYSPSKFVEPLVLDQEAGAAGIALVAVQYGSYIAVAPWTDISRELSLQGCFRIEAATGVINEVQDECGFVVTEMTLDIDIRDTPPQSPAEGNGASSPHLQVDESDLQVQSYIMSTKHNYRFMVLASTHSSLRAIDPTFGLICLANNPFASAKCTCPAPASDLPDSVRLFPLDSILSEWHSSLDESDSSSEQDESPASFIAAPQLFMRAEEYNIALSLSPFGCVVMGSQDCWKCAVQSFASNKHNQRRIIRRPEPPYHYLRDRNTRTQ
jgi:hypothetical protein